MEALLNASSANNAENPSVVTLVKFPAGKLTKEDDSQRVVADPRSGIFQIVVNPEDALTHLQWRPRGVSTPEDDLIIFPGEAELVPVQSTPDRVFVLKWKEGSQRLFIWMQSADPDSDIVHVETVNHVLTEGPRGAQSEVEAQRSSRPALATSAQPEASAQNTTVTLQALQQAMAGTASGVQVVTPTIGELLAPDVLRAAFEDDAMADALSDLRELLPEQERCDPNALADVLRSPALKAQAAALTNAMANGGVVDLLASFALPLDDPTAATAVGAAGLQAFFRALRKISR